MRGWFQVLLHRNKPFVPQPIRDRNCGPRPSVASLLDLVDTTDPAFGHVAAELQDMRAAGVELDEVTIGVAIKVGTYKHAREANRYRTAPERRSIVYYIRRGDLIKIGTTVDPVSRLKMLMPDEILAFEPGGREDEARRHKQFSWCRVARKGEYFRMADKLMTHVATLRELHGPPDEAWPSVATLGRPYARTREKNKVIVPEPKNREMVTVAEGASRLGNSRQTIYGWIHRELISVAGRTPGGGPLYYMEQLQFLYERNKAWVGYAAKRRTGSGPD